MEFNMIRNTLTAIFWITLIVVILVIVPKEKQPQGVAAENADLVGQSLYDDFNEQVGTITEVVVNVETGSVEYLIVQLEPHIIASRSVAEHGTYIVVPWESVAHLQQATGVFLTVEQAKVQTAPHLITLPDTTQSGWDAGMREAWQ
jgi:sporulation protein YlmC with PRC-barrel domain